VPKLLSLRGYFTVDKSLTIWTDRNTMPTSAPPLHASRILLSEYLAVAVEEALTSPKEK